MSPISSKFSGCRMLSSTHWNPAFLTDLIGGHPNRHSVATEGGMETGKVRVEKVRGRSTVTRCFSKYPVKFIVPGKVGPSQVDAVWIYSLTYGGGIVSGDSMLYVFTVGDGCTAVLTTQASTKVYKSQGSKCSEQVMEARIGSDALFVVIPDPVTCFSTARYYQRQIFRVAPDSNLVLVDWITSGRHETGERWHFDFYKSTNSIYVDEDHPLFLDTVLIGQGSVASIAKQMQDYRVMAMVVLFGRKLTQIQSKVREDVKRQMSQQLHGPSAASLSSPRPMHQHHPTKPDFVASCSAFGPQGAGLVVRVAAVRTESVYRFLKHQLADLEPVIGRSPYG